MVGQEETPMEIHDDLPSWTAHPYLPSWTAHPSSKREGRQASVEKNESKVVSISTKKKSVKSVRFREFFVFWGVANYCLGVAKYI